MRLAELQALFYALVSGEGEPPLEPPGFIVASAGASARRRLDLYAQAVPAKMADSLARVFVRVAALLGEARFQQLSDAHVASRPRERRKLRHLIRELPAFIAEEPTRWGRQDLADLASLEVARHEASLAEGGEAARAETLADLDEEQFARAVLRLSPAVRLLRLSFDVGPLWKALDEGSPAPAPIRTAAAYLVWRVGLNVFHSALERQELQALHTALAGAPLTEVCAAFGEDEAAADEAYAALHGWFADGLVVSVATTA